MTSVPDGFETRLPAASTAAPSVPGGRMAMSTSPNSFTPKGDYQPNPTGEVVDDDSNEGSTIVAQVKKYSWQPPADSAMHPYKPHQGEGAQYLRDFILGVNDGTISTFLLIVGVVGGGTARIPCLLTAIASAIAGSISMGLGEYVATKSQTEVDDGELKLEQEHFKYHRDVELEQLRNFLKNVNLSGNLLEAVVAEVGRNDESLLKMMMAFEFGVQEELERNPFTAMFMSGRLFFVGSLPTVIPFFIPIAPEYCLLIACVLVGALLFGVGAYKTKTTGGNPYRDGFENFALGAFGAAISFGVGKLFDAAT